MRTTVNKPTDQRFSCSDGCIVCLTCLLVCLFAYYHCDVLCHCYSSSFTSAIFMHDKSWMTALPTNNFEVRSLLYQHNERIVRRGRNNSNNAYNPEFGGGCPSSALVPHLPTCKFVGTGLSRFKNQEKLKVYTGAVYINASSSQQQPTPTNNDNTPKSAAMKTMTIADRSGSFQAMVTKKVRDELQNLLPPEDASSVSSTAPTSTSDKALDSNRRFLITIRMILLDGDYERKFFVLTNLAPMD
jgi:hypothetical protein